MAIFNSYVSHYQRVNDVVSSKQRFCVPKYWSNLAVVTIDMAIHSTSRKKPTIITKYDIIFLLWCQTINHYNNQTKSPTVERNEFWFTNDFFKNWLVCLLLLLVCCRIWLNLILVLVFLSILLLLPQFCGKPVAVNAPWRRGFFPFGMAGCSKAYK